MKGTAHPILGLVAGVFFMLLNAAEASDVPTQSFSLMGAYVPASRTSTQRQVDTLTRAAVLKFYAPFPLRLGW